MFTDQMFFSGATGMFLLLAMLTSFAMGCRILNLNKVLLHRVPGSCALPDTSCSFTVRNCAVRFSNDFMFDAHVARNNHDLSPLARRTSANGKEETSC